MWSVLAGDWDITITPEKCLERIKGKVYPGCIVVLHDSEKANDRLTHSLPGCCSILQLWGTVLNHLPTCNKVAGKLPVVIKQHLQFSVLIPLA